MADNNAAIRSYLKYYTSLKASPQFAVLITGEWGSGKTWFVRDFLAKAEDDGLKNLYVSLYGVESYRDIENAFFVALHPRLGSKKMGIASKIVGGVAAAAGAYFLSSGVDPEGAGDLIKTMLTDTQGYVLVFDDLERCSIPIAEILGYINRLVEHDGYKVVVICNEDRITAASDKRRLESGSDLEDANDPRRVDSASAPVAFSEIKEKTIGKTFRVIPEVEDATRSFITGLGCARTRAFLAGNADVLGEVYIASGYNNLRIVRNAILDFARLYGELDSKYTDKVDLQRELLGQFIAYSFEIQVGNIDGGDLSRIQREYFRRLMGRARGKDSAEESTPSIAAKYPAQNLDQPLISPELWAKFFVYGSVDAKGIHRELDTSPYFYDERTPDWQKIRDLWSLSADEFQSLHESVVADWKAGKIPSIAEVSQVAGVLFFLSVNGLSEMTADSILEDARDYVDRFRDDGRLLDNVDRWGRVGDVDGIVDSNSWGSSVPQYTAFLEYRDEQTRVALDKSWPQRATELLNLMKTDPSKFQLSLILSNSEENRYCTTVILSYIEINEFVAALMAIPRGVWRRIGTTFMERYKVLEIAPHLLEEKAWLQELATTLQALSRKHSKTLTGLQIEKLLLVGVENGLSAMEKFVRNRAELERPGLEGEVES